MLYPFDNNLVESLKGVDNPTYIALALATGTRESIRVRYVVACDGAHSWMRKRFTVHFDGDVTDSL